jgi:hypothetical protein
MSWNIGGMTLTGENRSTGGKTCPSATLSTTNQTWNDPETNPGHRGERPATNRLSPFRTSSWRMLSHLKPSGNYVYRHVEGYNFAFCVLYASYSKPTIVFLYNICQLVLLMEARCVLCDVGTAFLCIIYRCFSLG